jgi:5-methyltetrahydropteroyltriglutamate--homocysteine methyltransferase
MQPADHRALTPDVRFDGGNLDCGNGLLLLIRKHIDPLAPGQLLEVLSSELSVREDLPAWCRLTGNELVSLVTHDRQSTFLISKGPHRRAGPPTEARPQEAAAAVRASSSPRGSMPLSQAVRTPTIPASLPLPVAVPAISPLSVMGIGSWPRPRWLLRALHEWLEGRLPEREFQESADDAVRLAVDAQLRAGVDVLTDGEQRRDDYAGFVGGLLDNCQLIPITDLLPYVDHPESFAAQLAQLDVPAQKLRHPAVYGPLGRSRPLAVGELEFVRRLSSLPVKVALPGPYLLTRTMWMECISDRAYASREALADDIVRVLREELHFLLAAGAAIVQFDEPVLTEVVYGRPTSGNRSFMCGALGSRGPAAEELHFAGQLLDRVIAGLPRERLALHICRGNWTPDESAALSGDYRPLMPLLANVGVGTLFLELCTPRAGEMSALAGLPDELRVGVGVINQKSPRAETVDEIIAKATEAIQLFGPDRVLLNPDCGFATFADNPLASPAVAEAKLTALVQATQRLRRQYRMN